MTAHVRTIILNTESPERLVPFWSELLGVEVRENDDEAGIVWLHPDAPGGVNVGFQRVAQRAPGAPGVHVDIAVADIDVAAVRITELGGRVVAANRLDNGFRWNVMSDPDGNEFCVFVEG